jgi:hypothetical protein
MSRAPVGTNPCRIAANDRASHRVADRAQFGVVGHDPVDEFEEFSNSPALSVSMHCRTRSTLAFDMPLASTTRRE